MQVLDVLLPGVAVIDIIIETERVEDHSGAAHVFLLGLLLYGVERETPSRGLVSATLLRSQSKHHCDQGRLGEAQARKILQMFSPGTVQYKA